MTADEGTAYTSAAPAVLQAFRDYETGQEQNRAARQALSDRYGSRGLYVNRSGFGHGTRVVGFETLEGEKPGDVIGEKGELRIPLRGQRIARPNLRRKAGVVLDDEVRALATSGPDLPGMPGWTLVGLSSLAPALFVHGGVVWARWADDIERDSTQRGQVDRGLWDRRPMSEYFAVVETRDAGEKAGAAT